MPCEMLADNINSISQQCTDADLEKNIRTIHTIKKSFSRTYGCIKIQSLLSDVAPLLKKNSGRLSDHELLEHGRSLTDYIGRNDSLDSEIFRHLEPILEELKRRGEAEANDFVFKCWKTLEKVSIVRPSLAVMLINTSKSIFEKLVIEFIEKPMNMDYYVSVASDSPETFQTVSSILNEILIRSEGHDIILRAIASFVAGVMSFCQKKAKNYLRLYPRYCCRLVSILSISPDLFPSEKTNPDKSVTREVVLRLIGDMYVSKRKSSLMLLSHFQKWMLPFRDYLMESSEEPM